MYPDNGNGGFNYDVVMNNSSTVTIPAAVDIEIVSLMLVGGAIIDSDGSLTVQGAMEWSSGALVGDGSIQLAGATTISGPAPKVLSGSVTNSGTMTWQEGPISFFAQPGGVEAVLHNSGTIDMVGNGFSFSFSSGSPALVNEATGILRRLPTPGMATIDVVATNHGRVEVQASTLQFTRGLVNTNTGRIVGNGTIAADVISAGRVSPGLATDAPDILIIDGDYTQVPNSVLEIEVAGLLPGPGGHDRLIVTGTATLDGRLELPIVNGFMPVAGNEIVFLTANSVMGTFDALSAPNLAGVVPEVAVQLVYNPNDVRAQFVTPIPSLGVAVIGASTVWSDPTTWLGGTVPTSVYNTTVQNPTGLPPVHRTIHVQNQQNAFTHKLTLTGTSTTRTMTIQVHEGHNLSATAGATISNNGIILLEEGGNLVSPAVNVISGGRLSGDGTVIGNLTVGNSGGLLEATLDPRDPLQPGSSVGDLVVAGDYQQVDNGTLLVEVTGTAADGEFDTINVTGNVDLGGTLRIDATNFTSQPGTTFRFLTADGLDGPGAMFENIFTNVETIGNDNISFALRFTSPSAARGAVVPAAMEVVLMRWKSQRET